MAEQRFEAVLEAYGTGIVLVVPDAVADALSSRRRLPVRGTVNGTPFRTTIAPMGGRRLIGLNRELRERAGVAAGDTVVVTVEVDDEPRVVEVPDDLAAALDATAGARAAFDAMSYPHRREYVEWVTSAKKAATRESRVAKAVEMIRQGRSQR